MLNLSMSADNSTDTKKSNKRIRKKEKNTKKSQVSHVISHLSGVRCQLSCATCSMLPVTCHKSQTPKATATDPLLTPPLKINFFLRGNLRPFLSQSL